MTDHFAPRGQLVAHRRLAALHLEHGSFRNQSHGLSEKQNRGRSRSRDRRPREPRRDQCLRCLAAQPRSEVDAGRALRKPGDQGSAAGGLGAVDEHVFGDAPLLDAGGADVDNAAALDELVDEILERSERSPSSIFSASPLTAAQTPSVERKTMVSFSLPRAALATTKATVALSPSVRQCLRVTQNLLLMVGPFVL